MPRPRPLTWTQALADYETHLRARRMAMLTIAHYLRALDHLREYVDPLHPHQIKLAALREFQAGLLAGTSSRSGKPLSPSAVCRQTCAWRSFFSFLAEEGLLQHDPSARLQPPKVPRRTPGEVLTVKEIERLLNAADLAAPTGLRDRAVVEFMYATGLRRAETCGLDLTALDHDEREVRVQGKGGHGRIVPITRTAYGWLRRYLDVGRPKLVSSHPDSVAALFLSRFGTRLSERTLKRVLDGLREQAKIRKPVTPHTIRRTFATHLLKGGADLRTIQHLLGHASLAVTASYLRLDAGEVRRTVLLHHPRERFQ